jgi:hypothetical protein
MLDADEKGYPRWKMEGMPHNNNREWQSDSDGRQGIDT